MLPPAAGTLVKILLTPREDPATRTSIPRRRRSQTPAPPASVSVPVVGSVREATFEVLRARGMTRIFGNPGSTELPMLAKLPEDFTYVLGLQELVVVGMADGFA